MVNKRIARVAGAALVAGIATTSLAGCSLIELVTGGSKPTSTTSQSGGESTQGTSNGGGSTTESTSSSSGGSGSNDSGYSASIYDVKVGDCFTVPASATLIDEITMYSSCDAPHQYEAYFTATMTGTTYPGDSAVSKFADEQCAPEFDKWVKDSSKYDYFYISPSQESWEQSNDREILCVVEARNGSESTGSAGK